MTIPSNSTLSIIALGIGIFLAGGALGGAMTSKRQAKAEMKEIQQQQKEILERMEAAHLLAVENEKKALNQIDSIYNLLGILATKEASVRSNISKIRDRINNNSNTIDVTKAELRKQIKEGRFILNQDPPNF